MATNTTYNQNPATGNYTPGISYGGATPQNPYGSYSVTPNVPSPVVQNSTGSNLGSFSGGYQGYAPANQTVPYQPPSVSTTTVSNANKIQQVPGMVNNLNNLSNKGVSTDANGNPRYADGSFVQQQNPATDYSGEDASINQILDQMRQSTDASTKAQIDNIQQRFAQRQLDQKDVNDRSAKSIQNSLLMGGVTGQGSSSQYAPISSQGIVTSNENYGIRQLSALDSAENDAIAQAKQAQADQNYKLLETQIGQINAIRNQKLALGADLNKTAAEKNAQNVVDSAISEQLTSGEKDPAKILSNLKANGITATAEDVFNGIKGLTQSDPTTEVVKLGNGNTVLINKVTGAIIKSFGGAASTDSGLGIPSSVVRSVSVGGVNTPVNGYALKAGDDPYLVAQQYGTDMSDLQELNPTVTDWHNLPVGTVLNVPNSDDSWLKGKTDAQVQAYNSIPGDERASVKQLVNGDALIADIVKSRGKDGQAQVQKLINEATRIDPEFSINANKQRYQYKTQFNDPNSKSQAQIVAINTGLGHLAEFNQAAEALGNNSFKDANSVKNYLAKHSGDPAITNFNTVATALASELATIYKGGTAPTDSEIKDWQNNIYANFSKAQSQGVSDITSSLISNKLASLGQGYKSVMGSYPDSPLISPDTVQTLQNAGVNVKPITDKLKAQGYSVPSNSSEDFQGQVIAIGNKSPEAKSQIQAMLAKGASWQDIANFYKQ